MVGGERERQHGDKLANFGRIAELWNAWLKIRRDPVSELTAEDIGHMLGLLKKARTQSGDFNGDDYLDDIGYAACTLEIAHALQPVEAQPHSVIMVERNCLTCKHADRLPDEKPCHGCVVGDRHTGRDYTKWEWAR